ncbi:hypothetical protein AAF712_014574, partial [Marasmius tenuissimus]
MATPTAVEPEHTQSRLTTVVLAVHASVDDHPLLELGDTALTYMVALIGKDPAHKIDEKRYREFYSVIQTIINRLEEIQGKLDAGYKAAAKSYEPPVCKWEDGLILTGGVVATISDAPELDLLKPVGRTLSQIGELVKTIRGNRAEYADLHRLAAGILAELSSKMQRSDVRPTEDMECSLRDFERILVRIHDAMAEVQRESRTKRWGRLLFANKTKEELASLRKELGDAHNRFMAS